MKQVRCKNCHAISYIDDKYCMFCGTEFSKAEDQVKSQTPFSFDKLFLTIKIIVGILICVIGFVEEVDIQVLIYATMFIELFIHYLQIVVRERMRDKPRLQTKVSKRVDDNKSRVRRMVIMTTLIFVSLTVVIGYLNTIELPDTRNKGQYEFEIEPGYGFVSPISVLEMTSRINNVISSVTEDYENLVLVDNYTQFNVNVDINTTDNFRDAEDIFRKLVDVIYTSDKYYSYLTDFHVHFYHNDEYVYSARILNMFLIEEISLDNDGTFYDVKSNTTVLFKTLIDKKFTFNNKLFNEFSLNSSSEKYKEAHDEWYLNLADILSRTYNAFDLVNIRFINRGINPEKVNIVNLENRINDLKKQCKELDRIEPDFYHEAFYNYSQKGCYFYIKSFELNLDGLENLSKERIEYSYTANNVGYTYIYGIYE